MMENTGLFKSSASELADYLKEMPDTTFMIFIESEIDKRYNNAIESTGTVEIYTQSLALKHLMYEGPLVGGPWVWLVKRDYLVENEICFPNYSHGDDTVWVFKLLLNSNNIGYYNKVGYPDSAAGRRKYSYTDVPNRISRRILWKSKSFKPLKKISSSPSCGAWKAKNVSGSHRHSMTAASV